MVSVPIAAVVDLSWAAATRAATLATALAVAGAHVAARPVGAVARTSDVLTALAAGAAPGRRRA